jgi:uncharacterized membrane protein HdeD (DUF308 family)
MIAKQLTRAWWILLLQGVLVLLFGLGAIAWPFRSLGALVGLFAVISLVSGTISLVRGFSSPGASTMMLVIQGIIGIVTGLLTLLWPGLTAVALVYVIAAWIICQSILQFVLVFQVQDGRITLVLSGVVGLITGLWMAAAPGEGALAIAWLMGISMVIWGATLVAAGWQLRGIGRRLDDLTTPATA